MAAACVHRIPAYEEAGQRGSAHRLVSHPPGERPGAQRALSPSRSARSQDSLLSICSEDSLLSIGSEASLLSIGSVGSVLSIGSVGSAASAFSIGSAASAFSVGSAGSLGSVLSAASRFSALSYRADRAIRNQPARAPAVGITVGALLATGLLIAWAGVGLRNRGDGP